MTDWPPEIEGRDRSRRIEFSQSKTPWEHYQDMYIKENENEHSVILPLEMALLVFLPLLLTAVSTSGLADNYGAQLDRKSFPHGFIFGTASSAYQYEGGTRDDGKGLSNWDKYTHSHPERILDKSNGDVAVDQYHHYKEDVKLMKDMFLDAYRFSISWSRLLPNGSMSEGINRRGVNYYNNLINELLSKGLQPFVTLFHWDSPKALEEQYGGFLSPNIVEDFRDYAEVCFREFGDRVKHWITFNEPHVYSVLGYVDCTRPMLLLGDWEVQSWRFWQRALCRRPPSTTSPCSSCKLVQKSIPENPEGKYRHITELRLDSPLLQV